MSQEPETYGELTRRLLALETKTDKHEKWLCALDEKAGGVGPLGSETVAVPKARLAELERVEQRNGTRGCAQLLPLVGSDPKQTLYERAAIVIEEQRAKIASLEASIAYHKECFSEVIKERDEADKKVAALEAENKTLADANARLGAADTDRYDEALADCLRSLRAVLGGGKVACPFDADLVVALSEVARLVDDNRTLEAAAADATELARACAWVGWDAGTIYGIRIGRKQEFDHDLMRRSISQANGNPFDEQIRNAVIAKARARLAAKQAPTPTEAVENFKAGRRDTMAYGQTVPTQTVPAADPGAFKSTEEDAELSNFGRRLFSEFASVGGRSEAPVGSIQHGEFRFHTSSRNESGWGPYASPDGRLIRPARAILRALYASATPTAPGGEGHA